MKKNPVGFFLGVFDYFSSTLSSYIGCFLFCFISVLVSFCHFIPKFHVLLRLPCTQLFILDLLWPQSHVSLPNLTFLLAKQVSLVFDVVSSK